MTVAEYTYLQLQEEVLTHQFSPTKYRELVKTWLNQAQRRLVIESEIRTQEESETITTSAALGTYALPANFSRTIDLFNSETHELLTKLEVKDYDSLPTSSGRPYGYATIGTNILLYPVPDGVYSHTLRFWKLPPDMSADSDTPEIPAQYQELLIAFAMQKAFMREDDFQASQVWQAVWEKGVLKMRGEVQSDTADGPSQVPGSFGDINEGSPNTWRA